MNTLILSILFFTLGYGSGQDFFPSSRQVNLAKLANKIDRFIQVPRGFYDGSFLREDNINFPFTAEDLIGMRGNFDDMDNKISMRSNPFAIMENRADFGPPLPPTQWQLMVAPFTTLLPDISKFCGCAGVANCGCCLGVLVKPLEIRNNVCLNASLTKDGNTQSKHMIHAKFYYDTFKLLDISVSEKQPPMVCLGIPFFPNVAGCVQVVDVYRDRAEEKFCLCIGVVVQFKDRPLITIPTGCLCLGKPIPDSQKRGIFGNMLSTVSNLFG